MSETLEILEEIEDGYGFDKNKTVDILYKIIEHDNNADKLDTKIQINNLKLNEIS